MQETHIALNKKKTVQYLIGSLLFAIVGMLMIAAPQYFTHSEDTRLTKIIGYCCFVLFGLGTVLFGIKVFNKKPGLILNEDGIVDQTSAVSNGLIQWTDIKNVYAETVSDHPFIMIDVKNPQKYLEKQKNPIARRAMEINMQLYKTPIHINVNLLNTNAETLLQSIQKYTKK
ncbi:MAG: hypothetical protein E6Q95_05520 [Chitinophagaceae bacterium]|nr:MAG: hypothetical protein E6Q95_05520 [Chitinophagaceae bacterium]